MTEPEQIEQRQNKLSQVATNKENIKICFHEDKPPAKSFATLLQPKEIMENKNVKKTSINLQKALLFNQKNTEMISENEMLLNAFLLIQSLHENKDKVQKLLNIFQTIEEESTDNANIIQKDDIIRFLGSSNKQSSENLLKQKEGKGKVSINIFKTKSNLLSIRCFNDSLILTSIKELQNKQKLTNKERIQNYDKAICDKKIGQEIGSLSKLIQLNRRASVKIEEKDKQSSASDSNRRLSVKIEEKDNQSSASDSDKQVSFCVNSINCQMKRVENSVITLQEDEIKSQKSSGLLSSTTYLSIKDIQLPNFLVTQEIIDNIFQNCSIFLTNLSLCIFIKFAIKNKQFLINHNICWLLSISTVIAFKIYYDEQIQDLIEHFSKILKVQQKDLIILQRWFLQKTDYKMVISNRHYQEMMTLLLRIKIL